MSFHFPSKTSSAFWKVAPKLGIDLSDAIRTEQLTPESLSGMLRACDSCWHARKCARWLEDQPAATGGASMPDFCPSSAALKALADSRLDAAAERF